MFIVAENTGSVYTRFLNIPMVTNLKVACLNRWLISLESLQTASIFEQGTTYTFLYFTGIYSYLHLQEWFFHSFGNVNYTFSERTFHYYAFLLLVGDHTTNLCLQTIMILFWTISAYVTRIVGNNL